MQAPVTIDKVGRKLTVTVTKGHMLWTPVTMAIRDITRGGRGTFVADKGWYEFGMVDVELVTDGLRQFNPAIGDGLATWQLQQSEVRDSEYDIPDAPEPWAAHQIEGILFLLRNANAPLLDDQGLGKTRMTAAAIYKRLEMGAIRRCVVVAPKSVREVWVKEFARVFPDVKVWMFKSGDRKKDARMAEAQVIVTHYEGMIRHGDLLRDWVGGDMAVLDEGHRVKQRPVLGIRDSKRTVVRGRTADAIDKLSSCRFKVLLTGTLVANHPEDVWFPMNWCVEGMFPEYWTWLRSIAVVGNEYSKTAIASYKIDALNRLSEQIRRVSLRRLKKDCLDLPERTHQIRTVGMTQDQIALYEQCRLGLLGLYDEIDAEMGRPAVDGDSIPEVMNPLQRTLRLAQIAANPRMISAEYPESLLKYQEAIALIEDCAGPVVVWSCYKYDLYRMQQLLEEQGIGSIVICGDVPAHQRAQIVDTWRIGMSKVLLATPASYREGVTLNEADTMIYLNRSWNFVDRSQSQDRNYRMGQTKSTTIYDIVVPGTMDEATLVALQRKQQMLDLLQTPTPTDPDVRAVITEYLQMQAAKGD